MPVWELGCEASCDTEQGLGTSDSSSILSHFLLRFERQLHQKLLSRAGNEFSMLSGLLCRFSVFLRDLWFWEISGAEQKAGVPVHCTEALEVKRAQSNGKAICGEARVVRKVRVQLSLLQALGSTCGFCGAASPSVGLLPQLRVWAASCCRLLALGAAA